MSGGGRLAPRQTSGQGWGMLEKSPDLPGHDQLFVRRNHQDFHPGSGCADNSFGGTQRQVAFGVQHQAELIEIGTNSSPGRGPVLANAGCEYQRVRSIQLEQKSADPMARLVDENIQRQLGARVSLAGLSFDIAEIVVAA